MKKLKLLQESGACRNVTTVPFDERPPVDRNNLGPFVRGYCNQALMPYPFNDLDDLSEPALQQMARDCIAFYWRNRELFEVLWTDPFNEYSEKEAGRDFWVSRNGDCGFLNHVLWPDDPDLIERIDVFEQLEQSAVGFGPFELPLLEGQQ